MLRDNSVNVEIAGLDGVKMTIKHTLSLQESLQFVEDVVSGCIGSGDNQYTLLEANQNPSTTALYYVKSINCLAKWDGSRYVQINPDTGAIEIETVGAGNAVTAASYDMSTRKITLTKSETFLKSADFSDITTKVEQAEQDIAAIELLIGDESVEKQVQDAIADLNLDETYDKLGAASDAIEQAKSYADDLSDALDKRIDTIEGLVDQKADETVVDALDDRVAAIEDDYLKSAAVNELDDRITAIEDDYLKSADKDELEAEIEDVIDKKADKSDVEELDKRVDTIGELALRYFCGATFCIHRVISGFCHGRYHLILLLFLSFAHGYTHL